MPDNKETSKPLTKAQEVRKTTKPIMEKRRRARINASLCELKALLLDVMKKEGARTNKMEKADILEMTVKHLRTVQRQQFEVAVSTDSSVFNKYQSGFNECATEVSRYLGTVDGIEVELRSRLLNHLSNCVQSLDNSIQSRTSPPVTAHVRPMQLQQQQHNNAPVSPPLAGHIKSAPSLPVMTLSEINNNVISNVPGLAISSNNFNQPQNNLKAESQESLAMRQIAQEHVKGTDLAAFVIPSNMLAAGQMPGYIIPLYSGHAGKCGVQEGNSKASSLNIPTVVPVPIQLQPSPHQAYQPPTTESKGMDLTIDRQNVRSVVNDMEVDQTRSSPVDIKVPIVEPDQRNIAPAENEPMWRPW